MKRDRLAFAVRVGREDQLVGVPECVGDGLQPRLGLGVHFPAHREVGVGLDRTVLGRQVADVAEAGQHLVGGPQVLIDRFGFGGRLDD